MRNHPESDLQKACVKVFYQIYPSLLCVHIPNGGYRNVREAARMKAEGVCAGMPDILIPVPMKGYGSLYIELKAGKGVLSPKQMIVHEHLKALGNKVVVCRSSEEFIKEVENYLK